jgi:site-specific DNA-cytosine methylase
MARKELQVHGDVESHHGVGPKASTHVPLLSFFTGGGFLDVGLHQAGFHISWTNEVNTQFADMYEAAMLGLRTAWNDSSLLTKVSNRSSIAHIKPNEVLATAFGARRPNLFGVVGGRISRPPDSRAATECRRSERARQRPVRSPLTRCPGSLPSQSMWQWR